MAVARPIPLFAPVTTAKKPDESGGEHIVVEIAPSVAAIYAHLQPGSLMVGFALETGDAESRGRTKLERKQLDLVVVNDALEPGAGFEVDTNRVTLLDRFGERVVVPLQDKRAVAGAILDEVERLLG